MPACILTTKDVAILETMLARRESDFAPFIQQLREKIRDAAIVFRQDIPETVATLNSRVEFQVEGSQPDTRVISQDKMNSAIGSFLPITTARGLALLGMMTGQSARIEARNGGIEQIRLLRILHQPETAQRRMGPKLTEHGVRSVLRLIEGGRPAVHSLRRDDADGDGPSAA